MSIDPRLRERRKTVAEDYAKRNVARLLKFLASVLVVGAAVWAVFSPWLSVSQVNTSGVEVSTTHSVLAEQRVVAGTPMILIDPSHVRQTLLEDPWVAEATVRREWPDEVTVEVTERAPVAWVQTGGGWTRRAIDGVAVPSGSEPSGDTARIEMPAVSDSEATQSTDLLGALEFIEALPGEHEGGAVVTRTGGEVWATVAGFQVRLGRAVDMTEKALSLDALLEEAIPDGSTLVLIAPTNPALMTPEDNGEQTEESEDGNPDTSGDQS